MSDRPEASADVIAARERETIVRQEAAEAARAAAAARLGRIETARVSLFVAAPLAAVLLPVPFGAIGAGILFAPFIALVVAHGRTAARVRAAERRRDHAGDVLSRLRGVVPERAFDATPLVRASERDVADALHLAGPRGLLARLGRPRTHRGGRRLVEIAVACPTATERADRQAQTRSIAADADLLEAWAIEAADAPASLDDDAVAPWIEDPPRALGGPWGRVVDLLAAADTALVVAWFAGAPTGLLGALGGMLVHHLVWRPRAALVRDALLRSERAIRDLALAGRLAPLVAARPERVGSDLAARADAWRGRLRSLARRGNWVESLHNPFLMPWAWVTGSGTRLARSLERWRRDHGRDALAFLDELGAFDAATAVAAYAYEHPSDAWPEAGATDVARLVARAVRHPLLARDAGVANDIDLGDPAPRVLVVSGANMAGKSTWLRALGANELLARLGAPVAAASWQGGPFGLGMSLGVQDDLLAGVSRFQAEVARMAEIVGEARRVRPYLALLDELFGGTTSEDREIGARAILRHLLDAGALALLTTHDLALTRLATDDSRVGNVHLAAEVVDGRLHFDHKVRPGVVEGSSAPALLRAAGLLDGAEARGAR